MPRVVISDTSPLRYLVLIGQADLLPALYTEVLIPEAVAEELNQPATPEPVRRWIVHRPACDPGASAPLDCPSPILAPGGSAHGPTRFGIAPEFGRWRT